MEVITSRGKEYYEIENDGKTDVSDKLQAIFDSLNERGITSVSFYFLPGVYYINKPIKMKFISVKLVGEAHGGVDIHGMNLPSGTIFNFGKDCYPNCLTFESCGADCSFPAGETPWGYKTTRISLQHMNFMGYNNTDVDTQKGYSRFRGDEPNFRGLFWNPQKDRYADNEKDGQRAIVIEKSNQGEKPEMLSVEGCYFTDLYVGLEIHNCDVSNIHHSWFGQLVHGIRYHGAGQCIMMHDNCFADLQTAVNLNGATMSSIHNNTFAYLSKCFVLENASEINVSSNAVKNWELATGSAPHGAFLNAKGCVNINVNSNTVYHAHDSQVKNLTVDKERNGCSFVHFEKCENVAFVGNILNTKQSETVVCFENCDSVLEKNNLIKCGEKGNFCAKIGNCSDVNSENLNKYIGAKQ